MGDNYEKFKTLIKKEKNLDKLKELILQSPEETLRLTFSKENTYDANKLDLTLLHLAAKYSYREILVYVLDELKIRDRSILDLQTKGQRTPFMLACQKGHLEVVKLLSPFSNYDIRTASGTPLMLAVESGKIDLVKYLIEDLKVPMTGTDSQGLSPVYVACYFG